MLSKGQYVITSGLLTSLAIYDIYDNILQNTEKGLLFEVYSVIYLRLAIPLIMRYFYGS